MMLAGRWWDTEAAKPYCKELPPIRQRYPTRVLPLSLSEGVVLGRAIGFHVAEAACCFVLAKSTENPEKRVIAMQREQRALLEVQRFERIAVLERRIFEHAFAAFDQVEQQLGAPVEVQALPAAGQTGEAAQAATAKRSSAKPITAQFQTLDASQATESEGSSNGHRSFRRQR